MHRALVVALLTEFCLALSPSQAIEPPPLLPPAPSSETPGQPSKPPKPLLRNVDIPVVTLPETTGVEIDGPPADPAALDAVQKAGFRWARIDVAWTSVEKQRGSYDLAAYDALVPELKRRKIDPLFALDAANPLYEGGALPQTDVGRAAFAAFAGGMARHFRRDAALWEIGCGEGEGRPAPDPAACAALVAAAAKAMHAANPKATVLAGATRGIDLVFLQSVLLHGLADAADGIAVHPFRDGPPESLADDLDRIRTLLRDAAPRSSLQVWVTSWGYSAGGEGISEEQQARYLVRAALFDFRGNLPITVWTKLEGKAAAALGGDDGIWVGAGASARPAYRAAAFMNSILGGLKLRRVRELPDGLYGLVFVNRGREVNVLWSAAGETDLTVQVRKAPDEGLPVYNLYGEPLPGLKGPATSLHLTGSPVYVQGRLDIAASGDGTVPPMESPVNGGSHA